MIIGMQPEYPLSTYGNKKTARCRLCNSKMVGIQDPNIRFYGDCCESIREITDVFPRKIKPILIPQKSG